MLTLRWSGVEGRRTSGSRGRRDGQRVQTKTERLHDFCRSTEEPPMSLVYEVKHAEAFVPFSRFLSRWNRFPTNYPVTAARHARSALLAVIIPGCSLLTNHMLMLTAETGARVLGKGRAREGNRGALEMHMTDIRADLWPLLPAEVSAFTTGL